MNLNLQLPKSDARAADVSEASVLLFSSLAVLTDTCALSLRQPVPEASLVIQVSQDLRAIMARQGRQALRAHQAHLGLLALEVLHRH